MISRNSITIYLHLVFERLSLVIFYFSVIWMVLINHNESVSVLPKRIQKYIYGYLCGSDFENYATRILFWQAQKRNPTLSVLHEGKCKKICQIYAPVCANNGKTYHNECQLEYAMKKSENRLRAKYKGPCIPYKVLSGPSDNNQYQIGIDYYFGTTEDNLYTRDCLIHC